MGDKDRKTAEERRRGRLRGKLRTLKASREKRRKTATSKGRTTIERFKHEHDKINRRINKNGATLERNLKKLLKDTTHTRFEAALDSLEARREHRLKVKTAKLAGRLTKTVTSLRKSVAQRRTGKATGAAVSKVLTTAARRKAVKKHGSVRAAKVARGEKSPSLRKKK